MSHPLSFVSRESLRCAAAAFGFALCGATAQGAPGDVAWSANLGAEIFGAPAVDSAGTIYVGTRAGQARAIRSTGAAKWTFNAGDWIDSSPTLSADESALYFGCWDNKLYAISAATGAKLWEFETGSLIVASPAVGPDGAIFFGSSDGFFYALNPNGAKRWEYFVGEEMDSSPAVTADGSAIYVGAFDGSLYAFASDGSLRWEFATAAAADPDDQRIKSSPTIGLDGSVYFGGGNGVVYALSPSGQLRWSFDVGEIVDTSIVIGLDGDLVFGSRDGYLYSLDANGVLNWATLLGDIFYSTPAIDADGRITVGNYVGDGVSAISTLAADGSFLWEVAVFDYVDSSPTIVKEGRLYAGGYDGYLYSVEAGPGLAESDWSSFGNGLANRSRQGDPIALPYSESYASWLAARALAEQAGDFVYDADGDGAPVLLEYAMGVEPFGSEVPAVEAGWGAKDGVAFRCFEFVIRVDDPRLVWALDGSEDLAVWSPIELGADGVWLETIDADALGDGAFARLRVCAAESSVAGAALFARLRVGFDSL